MSQKDQNHNDHFESENQNQDKSIRPVVVGVVWRDDSRNEILVSEHYDPGDDYTFYRPFGGEIEFGEHSEKALEREFNEELEVELSNIEYAGTYEDVFEFDGETGHEIWRVYEAEIVENWPYEEDRFKAYEPELNEELQAVWKPVDEFLEGEEVFYPEGYLEQTDVDGR